VIEHQTYQMEFNSTEDDLDRLYGGHEWCNKFVTWLSFGGCPEQMLIGLATKWFGDDISKQVALKELWDRHPRRLEGIIVALLPYNSRIISYPEILK
jgi:hypothetical protein